MKQPAESMRGRLQALTGTNRALRRDLDRRSGVEAALRKRSERFERLWKASKVLQDDLRNLTHQMLRAQEQQRQHLSHELQDGVAQTLLGIHVKLLALKRATRSATRGVSGGISSTQRMVRNSARTVSQATRALGKA